MEFVTIDFETANEKRNSACALGLIAVDDGYVVEKKSWLIKPPELRFSPFNIRIHGIRKSDVVDKPEFNEIWEEIHDYLKNKIVIAHNAGFDIGVLKNMLNTYKINLPELHYSCSRIISKRTWPGLISYSLDYVANYLGVDFKHHDALEDAFASAQIVLLAGKEKEAKDFAELAKELSIINGYISSECHTPAHQMPDWVDADRLAETSDSAISDHPFYKRTFVFTGTLQSLVRKEAMRKVAEFGGYCSSSVTENTNYLVLGSLDFRKLKDNDKSGKLKKVEWLLEQGFSIEVLNETDFITLLT